jgi:hypothetical protein
MAVPLKLKRLTNDTLIDLKAFKGEFNGNCSHYLYKKRPSSCRVYLKEDGVSFIYFVFFFFSITSNKLNVSF